MAEEDKKKKGVVLFKVFGVVVIILVIATPIILSVFMHAEIFSKALGDANGWLGYWGGYLGAIIGAITVFIATSLQLKSQKNLHKETLELQKSSVEISAKLADQQQRDLTISTLRINKIDSLVQELMYLETLNTDRFNILRSCNYYNHLVKLDTDKIRYEKKLLKAERLLNGKGKITTRFIKISKVKLNNNKIKRKRNRIDLKKVIERRKENIELHYEYLEKETAKRVEIRLSSAKLKSYAMFVEGLEDDLDEFRGYQTEILKLFYKLNVDNTISNDDYESLIEFHGNKTMKESNKAIMRCKQRLDRELLLFQKGNVRT